MVTTESQAPPPAESKDESPPKKGSQVKEEEAKGIIQFKAVRNDGKRDSMIYLTGLKNIYQKQLPKMPREYIARLVYDRNHESMAIVKKGHRTVGGITYRPFPGRKFAEIVFCAVTSSEQVKGYGSYLMNHLKAHVRKTSDVEHFLTYADNYAVGYFKKQGFTADITLDRAIWGGYIKDYEGGTIMQCTMLPKIDYLNGREIVKKQKTEVLNRLQLAIQQDTQVYAGIGGLLDNRPSIAPHELPGLIEGGWNPIQGKSRPDSSPVYPLLRQLLNDLQAQTWAWPFRDPVDAEQVPGYYETIKNPMDLKTMDSKLEKGQYKALEVFTGDFEQIIQNCKAFNDPKSIYVKCANKLDAFFKGRLKAVDELKDQEGGVIKE